MTYDIYLQGDPVKKDGALVLSLGKSDLEKILNNPKIKLPGFNKFFETLITSFDNPKSGIMSPKKAEEFIPALEKDIENIKTIYDFHIVMHSTFDDYKNNFKHELNWYLGSVVSSLFDVVNKSVTNKKELIMDVNQLKSIKNEDYKLSCPFEIEGVVREPSSTDEFEQEFDLDIRYIDIKNKSFSGSVYRKHDEGRVIEVDWIAKDCPKNINNTFLNVPIRFDYPSKNGCYFGDWNVEKKIRDSIYKGIEKFMGNYDINIAMSKLPYDLIKWLHQFNLNVEKQIPRIGGGRLIYKVKGLPGTLALKMDKTLTSENDNNNYVLKGNNTENELRIYKLLKEKIGNDTTLTTPYNYAILKDNKVIEYEEYLNLNEKDLKKNNTKIIILENYFGEGENLEDRIKKNKQNKTNFSYNEINKLFHNLLTGVKSLNEAGIYHRDIKPENVLISGKGDKFDTRLTDYANACLIDEAIAKPLPTAGTRLTVDPLLYFAGNDDGRQYTQSSEIYSIGATVLRAITGKTLFFYDPKNNMGYYGLEDKDIDDIKKADEEGNKDELERLKKKFEKKSLIEKRTLKVEYGEYLHDKILIRELKKIKKIPWHVIDILYGTMTANIEKRERNIENLMKNLKGGSTLLSGYKYMPSDSRFMNKLKYKIDKFAERHPIITIGGAIMGLVGSVGLIIYMGMIPVREERERKQKIAIEHNIYVSDSIRQNKAVNVIPKIEISTTVDDILKIYNGKKINNGHILVQNLGFEKSNEKRDSAFHNILFKLNGELNNGKEYIKYSIKVKDYFCSDSSKKAVIDSSGIFIHSSSPIKYIETANISYSNAGKSHFFKYSSKDGFLLIDKENVVTDFHFDLIGPCECGGKLGKIFMTSIEEIKRDLQKKDEKLYQIMFGDTKILGYSHKSSK